MAGHRSGRWHVNLARLYRPLVSRHMTHLENRNIAAALMDKRIPGGR